MGQYDKAIECYNKAIQLDPESVPAYRSLAWLLATCRDETYRDGKRAVEEITKAGEITKWQEYTCLSVLAAAQAEAGDFEAAVEAHTKAIEKAPADRKAAYSVRLEFYKAGKPYRDERKK